MYIHTHATKLRVVESVTQSLVGPHTQYLTALLLEFVEGMAFWGQKVRILDKGTLRLLLRGWSTGRMYGICRRYRESADSQD